ncbi:MAG: hypothetical protein ACYC2X_07795 [Coriobacteriia bacterium]
MKRIITISLVIALALTLMLPAAALAKRGGVPAGPNGKGAAAQKVDKAESAKPTPPGHEKRDVRGSEEETTGVEASKQARQRVRAEESSETPEPKLTGIENALSRLQCNLERMQANLDAGKRSSLPSGLQSVIAKFMSWLGIDADAPDGGLEDGDGSVEPTGTIEPTGTVEPTGTIEASATL